MIYAHSSGITALQLTCCVVQESLSDYLLFAQALLSIDIAVEWKSDWKESACLSLREQVIGLPSYSQFYYKMILKGRLIYLSESNLQVSC